MRPSKVSALILRGIFRFALLVGVVHFRPITTVIGGVKMEDSFRHRSWRKWLSVIFRILPLIGYLYTYVSLILKENDLVFLSLHTSHIILSVPCYLWIMGLPLFRGKPMLKLVNKMLGLFWRVRGLLYQKNVGFGGKRELILIILALLSQIVRLSLCFKAFTPNNIVGWLSLTYVVTSSDQIMIIYIMWYLYIGGLYAEVNEYARRKMQYLRNPPGYRKLIRQSEECLSLYKEIYTLNSGFQAMFNLCLTLCLMMNLLHYVVFSYKLIIDLDFHDLWMWTWFLKIIFDFLLITLAVEGAGNHFKGIRQIHFEICCSNEDKDLQGLMELLVTQLNLCPFRVRLLGLCDVSMELFLKIVSVVVAYIIFIIQCVLEIRKSKKFV